MSSVLAQKSVRPQIIHLSDVDWNSYLRLRRVFADRPAIRMTYDQGDLEIMIVSFRHECPADFLGHLVRLLTEELGLQIRGGGSLTMKYRKKKRGLEPDRCFWIANAARIHGVSELDLRIHPPPDLAIEVDVTSSSLNRMDIYAKLGVPEVWRLSKGKLTINTLKADGTYRTVSNSASFPKVSSADMTRFLTMMTRMDQNAVVAQFRKWMKSWAK